MIKSFRSNVALATSLFTLATAMLCAPLQASAANTVSQGNGVKCYWVRVSYDAATGASVYTRVCRKSGV